MRQANDSCPKLSEGIERIGRCRLEPVWDRSPYESLVRAVAHQQLHGRAAQAILNRLIERFSPTSFPKAKGLSRLATDEFRALGFSANKALAIQGIAAAADQGAIPDRETADGMSNDALIEQLTALRGVGRWTVEMILIFTLGRLDVFPADDFGVRGGLQILDGLPDMPNRKEAMLRSSIWTTCGSVVAWYLWRIHEQAGKDKG